MFTYVYLFAPIYSFTTVYPKLPIFIRAYLCIIMLTYVYHCFLNVYLYYSYLLVFTYVYTCLPTFTLVYLRLSLFTLVYTCLPTFTLVYRSLSLFTLFTLVYHCLLVQVYLFYTWLFVFNYVYTFNLYISMYTFFTYVYSCLPNV